MSVFLPDDDAETLHSVIDWPLFSLVENLEVQLESSFKGMIAGVAVVVGGVAGCAAFSAFDLSIGAIASVFTMVIGLTAIAGSAWLHKQTLNKLASLNS